MTGLLKRNVVITGALAFLTSAVSAGISMYLLYIVSSSISQEGDQTVLHPGFFLMLFAFLGVMVGARYVLSGFSSRLVFEIRQSLVLKIGKNQFQRIQDIGETRLYNMLLNDVDTVSQAFANLPMFFYNMITLILAVVYLASLSLYMFLFLLAIIVLNVFFSKAYFHLATHISGMLRTKKDVVIDQYKGLIFGKKELQLNQKRNDFFIHDRILPKLSELRLLQRKNQFYWGIHNSLAVVSMFLLFGLVINSEGLVSGAIVAQFLVAVMYFSGVFRELMGYMEVYSNALVAGRKIEQLSTQTQGVDVASRTIAQPPSTWERIDINDLTYQYPAKQEEGFSFGPVNFSIQRNETLVIVGGNGSGKSTFIKLMLGLLPAHSGSFNIDGEPVSKEDFASYQALFSAIHSDMHLFGEVLDAQGQPVPEAQIDEQFAYFELTGRVKKLEDSYAVTDLSQGQKKRFAMVNVLFENRDIIVLDEWAADQDPQFRKKFYRELLPELKAKGKTLIVISHDDHYFDVADRLIKFDAGQCQEMHT